MRSHKSSWERLLTTNRARVARALAALGKEWIGEEDGLTVAKQELEAVEESLRKAEIEFCEGRRGSWSLAALLHEKEGTSNSERSSISTDDGLQSWLIRTFTEADEDAAHAHHSLVSGMVDRLTFRSPTSPMLGPRVRNALGSLEVQEVMHDAGSFGFDALAFSVLPEVMGKPLCVFGAYLLRRSSLLDHMQEHSLLSDSAEFESRMLAFLGHLDKLYKPEVVYHCSAHAVDVMSTIEWLLSSDFFMRRTLHLDHFMCLTAAAIHDVGHPGRNNLFLTKTMDEVAVRYNDKSVLESMHVALSFQVMTQEKGTDWFSTLARDAPGPEADAPPLDVRQYIRRGLIDMVLATDMAKHQSHVNRLQEHLDDFMDADATPGTGDDKQAALEEKIFLLETALHAADISNACKPRPLMLKWTRRILDEFWAQGDEEQRLGLSISPLCDREAGRQSVPRGQTGFIDFVVQPLFAPLVELVSQANVALETLVANRQFWVEKEQEQAPFETIFEEGEEVP